jgi:membrane dipeptidase
MKTFPVADAHCDVLTRMTEYGCSFHDDRLDVNARNLLLGNVLLQVMAVWAGKKGADHAGFCRRQIAVYKRLMREEKQLLKAYDGVLEKGRISVVLMLEGADAVRRAADIPFLTDNDFSIVALTWNQKNALAVPAVLGRKGGLTALGKEAVKRLSSARIAVDVSHLNEDGFYDVCAYAKGPILASHSNAHALCPHLRNLTDEQVRMLIAKNGFIGLNFYVPFVGGRRRAHLIRHIEHMLALGAQHILGLGSDFDGIDEYMDDLRTPAAFGELANDLARLNYPDELIGKIMAGNFLHFLLQLR